MVERESQGPRMGLALGASAKVLSEDRSGLGPPLPVQQWERWAETGARTLGSRQGSR